MSFLAARLVAWRLESRRCSFTALLACHLPAPGTTRAAEGRLDLNKSSAASQSVRRMHESMTTARPTLGNVHHGGSLLWTVPNLEERAIADGTSGLPWQTRTGDQSARERDGLRALRRLSAMRCVRFLKRAGNLRCGATLDLVPVHHVDGVAVLEECERR